ncbi:MAG TPA: threonine/serine exporter family protein [Candidatus Rikenella faecigallinarum]|uniref:Threonine/serine exporter family protein n=1 Tax=Candidatus Rikenella faecigallinarum TaxID=2838745 RepID=A0A9D1QCG1_9BACT|nr:threonine/serine exporter family protein [Candidatus Rikenella faecigallinarum]
MTLDIIIAVILDGIFAAVAAIGFAVISNPPRKALLGCAILAAVGHGLRYFLINQLGLDITTASLFAAFSIGLLSLWFADRIHCPAEVFAFPSLLPMIPGMFAYKTILGLMKFLTTPAAETQNAEIIADIMRNGLTTLFVLFALVLGVALPMFLFHKQSYMMTRLFRPKARRKTRALQ